MLDSARLLQLADFVKNSQQQLQLLASLTSNQFDDWLVKLLIQISNERESIDQVVAWLQWVGIVRGTGDGGQAPLLPASFAPYESSLRRLQTCLLDRELGS